MSAENKIEGEAEAETSFVSNENIIYYFLTNATMLIIGIIMSIILLIYLWKKDIKLWKKILIALAPFVTIFTYMYIRHSPKPSKYYFLSVLYRDKPIDIGFNHKSKAKKRWPFLGSAILNVGNDEMVFIGGGENQKDALLVYNNDTKQFDNIIDKINLSDTSATYSAMSMDLDNNNLDDLIVGRTNGVFLYKQIEPLKFEKIKLYDAKKESV
jgi:hypothetical protein